MNIHTIRSLFVFVALVMLVGFVFGFTLWTADEATPTTHTVIIADECDVLPNPVNAEPGDIIQFEAKEEAGQCTVLIDQSDLTDVTSLAVPGSLTVKADAPVGRDYPYDVQCSGGLSHNHEVPGDGLGFTPDVTDAAGGKKACSHTRIHVGSM